MKIARRRLAACGQSKGRRNECGRKNVRVVGRKEIERGKQAIKINILV